MTKSAVTGDAVMDDAAAGRELAAWQDFCDVLRSCGERCLAHPDSSNPDPTEAVRHLATQVVCWLGDSLAVERDLGLHRLNDLLTPWGGPNADNVYRYAAIDDRGTYRLRGRMHGCEELLFALRVGNLHQKAHGTLNEASASDFGIGVGDEVDLLLRPAGDDRPGDITIPPGTRMLSIREYYFDWQAREPAVLLLERVDGTPPAGGITGALAAAGEQLTESLSHWSDYMDTARARGVDNSFIAPRREPSGLQTMHYSFCFWSLQPDEALVVRFTEPVARYWSVQIYQLRWFEALDLGGSTSLNNRQATLGPDGVVTVVLAAGDPGYANWLDTEGRATGLLTFRGAWLQAPAPQATAEVVKLADLAGFVGAGEARVDAATRASGIAARREHLRWRFRT